VLLESCVDTGLYNNLFSNLSLWASNFLDWLVQIKTSLVQKFWPEDKKKERKSFSYVVETRPNSWKCSKRTQNFVFFS
jgi:hypothetical protein